MPFLHQPSPESLNSWLEARAGELSYQHGGGVEAPPEAGFLVDRHRLLLGQGGEVYERAGEALRSWPPGAPLCRGLTIPRPAFSGHS